MRPRPRSRSSAVSPSAGAVKYLDKQTRSLYDYKNLNNFFAKAPLYANPPVKSSTFITIDKVIAKWQEIKAS